MRRGQQPGARAADVCPRIQATEDDFAAIKDDGTVVTWGAAKHGGDSSQLQEQLTCVQQIQAVQKAFAAIKDDGTIVTWGEAECGGASSAVVEQLRRVRYIQATTASAAIKDESRMMAQL